MYLFVKLLKNVFEKFDKPSKDEQDQKALLFVLA